MLDTTQGSLSFLGNTEIQIETKHDFIPVIKRIRVYTKLSDAIQRFFSTHIMFTDEELRQYCMGCCGIFSDEEYNKALRTATNVFWENPNV